MKYLSRAQDALDRASGLINGPRQDAYGHPLANMTRIAERMKQILGVDVAPWQVAQVMVEVKLARLANGWHDDSIDDAIAYLALMKELRNDA